MSGGQGTLDRRRRVITVPASRATPTQTARIVIDSAWWVALGELEDRVARVDLVGHLRLDRLQHRQHAEVQQVDAGQRSRRCCPPPPRRRHRSARTPHRPPRPSASPGRRRPTTRTAPSRPAAAPRARPPPRATTAPISATAARLGGHHPAAPRLEQERRLHGAVAPLPRGRQHAQRDEHQRGEHAGDDERAEHVVERLARRSGRDRDRGRRQQDGGGRPAPSPDRVDSDLRISSPTADGQ